MDKGNKVQRAPVRLGPAPRLNVNAEVPTPFVVPWSWYIKQRLYWQLPKLLSVTVVADGKQDDARYAGLVHEDAQFGLSVSFNQTAALEKYAGYHLVSVQKVSQTELQYTLSRTSCPCSNSSGAARNCRSCFPGTVGGAAATGAAGSGDANAAPQAVVLTLPAGAANSPTQPSNSLDITHGANTAACPSDTAGATNIVLPLHTKDFGAAHPRQRTGNAPSSPAAAHCMGGARSCGQGGGLMSRTDGMDAGGGVIRASSTQGAAGRSASRARSGGSGTSGSTHSTATATGAPRGGGDGALPLRLRRSAGGSEDGAQDGARSQRRRGGGIPLSGKRGSGCSGTTAEESGSDGSSSSGSEDDDDSDESSGSPEPMPNNPFRKNYCSCPCHVWRKYWPDPDDPAKHQDALELKLVASGRGRRRESRDRAGFRARSDGEEEKEDDDDEHDEDWRATRTSGRKRNAAVPPEAARPARRARTNGAVGAKPPRPLAVPGTTAAAVTGHGQQRRSAVAGAAAQLPPLPPSAAAASLSRRGSSGGSGGRVDGSSCRPSGGAGTASASQPSRTATAAPVGQPDQPPQPSGSAPSLPQAQPPPELAGIQLQLRPHAQPASCHVHDVQQPIHEQPQHQDQKQQQPLACQPQQQQGQQSSAQTVIILSDSDEEVNGRRRGASGGGGMCGASSGGLVRQGPRGDHVSVEEGDEQDGLTGGGGGGVGSGANSDGEEQPVKLRVAKEQECRRRQQQSKQLRKEQRQAEAQQLRQHGRGTALDGGRCRSDRDGIMVGPLSLYPGQLARGDHRAASPLSHPQQQPQKQRDTRMGSVAARITAAAAARARRLVNLSPRSGTAIASPSPSRRPEQTAGAGHRGSPLGRGGAAARRRPEVAATGNGPAAAAARADMRGNPQHGQRHQAKGDNKGSTKADALLGRPINSVAVTTVHLAIASKVPDEPLGLVSGPGGPQLQAANAHGQVLAKSPSTTAVQAVRRITADWADVPVDVARRCGGDGGALPTGLQVLIDGLLLSQVHLVTWTTPGGGAVGPEGQLRLHGIPESCKGLQLLAWGSGAQAGVLVLHAATAPGVAATAPEVAAAEPTAAGGQAVGREGPDRLAAGRPRRKRQRQEEESDEERRGRAGAESERDVCARKEGRAQPQQPSLQHPTRRDLDVDHMAPDRMGPRQRSLPHTQQQTEQLSPRAAGQQRASAAGTAAATAAAPLVLALPGRPICRPGWDVEPLESGAASRPRHGSLVTDSRLPLDAKILEDRRGLGSCFVRLFVERDGLLDGYTAAKCVTVEDSGRGVTLDRLPSHARNCIFLGWGVLPGGTLVLRVQSTSPGDQARGSSGCGSTTAAAAASLPAAWPQPAALAAAAAAAVPIAAELERRRRLNCDRKFRSPATEEQAMALAARGAPTGGLPRPRKMVHLEKVLSYAPALSSQPLMGPLVRSTGGGSGGGGSARRNNVPRQSGGGVAGAGGSNGGGGAVH